MVYARYFPLLKRSTAESSEIARFIYKRLDLKGWILRLKKLGKRFFLVCMQTDIATTRSCPRLEHSR